MMNSAIFSGQVKHSRKTPLGHSFQYDVYMMYLDLEELDPVFEKRWLWSACRPAIARFNRKHYLGDPNEPLSDSVRSLVKSRTGKQPTGPIRVLTNLSCLGICFNPISIYYCFGEDDGEPVNIVAEVSNTPWGERHSYVLDCSVKNNEAMRAETRKELHVSPFMNMDVNYEWLLTKPSDDLVVRIRNRSDSECFFLATLILRRSEISGASLARTLIRFPLMTWKVMLGIYWQALRLWLKGVPPQIHPEKQSSLQAEQ